ncbi:cadmium-translocating P-type ATPase [Nesterenkonia sp. E16_7]|uniref:heavy metal translocating P-type ATPase n=1 Tax=unclassified Nesterenkonia TaxID=2629769 RepID=UPI001A912EA6|nr:MULTISPECIES: heavy metal translocating P-type ATPase [unclassified Nesterenkonia]MBO0594927.1 cadmium-translocating P-type ATPase [Nesterenkonia sp. E16_10]MBO0599863.1 cadmium-translocating P-type ATPase [Nesterenkonia sp. E16_7]
MRALLAGLRRYPMVMATLAVGLLGGALELSAQGPAARWLISGFALVIALLQVRRMVKDLRAGTYGIDLLAVTAIGSTVAVGEYWAALVVCLMLSGGEALEDYAAGRARRELTGLLENAPHTAHRLGPESGTASGPGNDTDSGSGSGTDSATDTGPASGPTDIPVEAVRVGDRLLVRPFEVVPVDGVLTSAAATFDESSLTGESLPVERLRGEDLLSGAVNGGEAIEVRATAGASESQYQRIIALVREAQESKAPFVRLADRVAVPFTLGALGLAAGAWALSGDPARAAEVLVVATPCPLIIAAPVAFMAGMSRAASNGIIVKSSGTLEQLARVRTAAFDKTGTLTHGRPEVTQVHALGLAPELMLALAAGVEQYSSHPLAAAVVAAARAGGAGVPPAEEVTEVPANGVRGTVQGRSVLVGSVRFIARETGATPDTPPVGHSGVHVAVDGGYAGYIALADELRLETRATMSSLHRAGVNTTMMLTGDGEHVARHIAQQAGIDDVRADLLPQDKVTAVQAAQPRPVMMVGDGVNDAPVLAVADVGVAMGARGSSAASESADVVITVDDLGRSARAVHIGRRTMRIAWQAIWIGVGMSVVLMVIAAAGLLPAIVGAWLQEVVDLACILWALLAMRPSRAERSESTRMERELAAARAAPGDPAAALR